MIDLQKLLEALPPGTPVEVALKIVALSKESDASRDYQRSEAVARRLDWLADSGKLEHWTKENVLMHLREITSNVRNDRF